MKFKRDSKIFVIGDLNQNLLNDNGDDLACFLNDFNLKNMVTKPTHFQGNSKTLIDVVCVSDVSLIYDIDVLDCPFSNHSFVLCNINIKPMASKSRFLSTRLLNDANLEAIRNLIQVEANKFNILESFECVDDKFSAFENILLDAINAIAPIKKFRAKKVDNCPWMDKELFYALKQRDIKHALFVMSGSDKLSDEWNEFRVSRNYFKSLSRSKMKDFYSDKICSKFKSPKDYWAFYKTVVKTKKSSTSSSVTNLIINDKIISDSNELADEFNKFFGSFELPRIVDEAESERFVNDHFLDLKRKNKIIIQKNFSFSSTTAAVVEKLLSKLDSSSSSGNCQISVKILKMCSQILAPVLAKLFNECIKQAKITKNWKFAIITPLFKGKGANDCCDNYRGISVLQPIAKIFERILANQIVIFFNLNNLFCPQQHGFRSGHSCETALHSILEDWKQAIEKKEILISLFIDFKKAFDLINPKLLFLKLFHYGFDNNSLELVKHYLTGRMQQTRVGECVSSTLDLNIGVPQGSVLGPLFFLIFINDLPYYSDLLACLFADDTTVYESHEDFNCLVNNFKIKIVNLLDWIKFNQMTINWKKSKIMFITNQKILIPINFQLDGNLVDVVNDFRLLGVNINNKFKFDNHVEILKSTINKKIFSLKKLFFLSRSTKIQFFKTFILPHFDYCNTLIIYFTKTLVDKLDKFFKICIFRLFNISLIDLSISDQISSLKSLNLFPLKLRYFFRLSLFSYRIVKNKHLKQFSDNLKRINDPGDIRGCDNQKELYEVPFGRVNVTVARLSIFLPNILNKVLKHEVQMEENTFCQYLKINILKLFNIFLNAKVFSFM